MYIYRNKNKMNKQQLIDVYQNTKEICKNIPFPKSEKITCGDDTPQAGSDIDIPNKSANIIVEPLDTVSALIKYSSKGKTAVLNMASSKRKGGGVENGAMAQEECLFRCSNLFTIPDNFYPIKNDQYIYTHQASFVKDNYYNIINPVKADVITIPAINLGNIQNYEDFGYSNDSQGYEAINLDKMFFMINSALISGCDNIILGAWGCGVFKNDPNVIASLFKETLESGLSSMFENIVFAIINDRNSVGNNYEIFKKIFS